MHILWMIQVLPAQLLIDSGTACTLSEWFGITCTLHERFRYCLPSSWMNQVLPAQLLNYSGTECKASEWFRYCLHTFWIIQVLPAHFLNDSVIQALPAKLLNDSGPSCPASGGFKTASTAFKLFIYRLPCFLDQEWFKHCKKRSCMILVLTL